MPRDPRAYLQRAEEHRRHGRLKEAIALSIEALGKHPGLDAVRVTLGRAYLENAQPDEARATLLEVFGRLPEHHLAGKLLVESQRLLGDLDGAASTCRTLLEHYPRDREIEPLLAEIVKAQSLPQAPGTTPPVATPVIPMPAREPKPAAAVPRSAATPPIAVPEPDFEEADPEPDYLPEDIGPMRAAAPPVPPPLAAAAPPPEPPAKPAEVAKTIEIAARIPATPEPAASVKVADVSAVAPAAKAPEVPIPAAPRAPDVPVPALAMKPPSIPAPPVPAVAAAPAPVPAAPATDTAAAPKRDALETNTLAELYVKQGLPDRAIDVYRSMLRVEPGNAAARRRLAELEAAGAGLPAPAPKAAAAAPAPRPLSTPAAPEAPAASSPMTDPVRSSAAVSAGPATAPVPGAPAAPPRTTAAPAPAPRNAADQVAVERLERWLDTVKRGQKNLDDGAAA